MAFFHTHIITGPIRSRRLGLSLGVNLLPTQNKVCNYDCVYCECGWNTVKTSEVEKLPTVDAVRAALRTALQELKAQGKRPDSLTFSGNGEPTLHPDFKAMAQMVKDCAAEFYSENRPALTLISNATQIVREDIRQAVGIVDRALLKLDAGTPGMYARINRLQTGFSIGDYTVTQEPREFYPELVRLLSEIPYPFTIQTLLFRGEYEGTPIDNTSGGEWEAYVGQLSRIRPQGIMLYGLDRETPAKNLHKLSREELEAKAEDLRRRGFKNVSAFF